MPENPLLDAALDYAARRGWPVFPCAPDDKRPLTKSGFKDATTDEATIKRWWSKFPRAMIAVPTGAPIGAIVIDLDPPEGKAAAVLLKELEAVLGEALPICPMVRTPRGGLHLYFAAPHGVKIPNRTGIIPHVDVRGDGGYVIVPPSCRDDGVRYREEGSGDA